MSAIFISHSSKDNDRAAELRELLEKQGHRSIFFDYDPEQGIPAGREWEKELYAQLRSCQAVIVLCSSDSMKSMWCFAEITHAKALGKQIFPLKVGDCVINTVLTSHQALDLTANPDDAYKRLWRGLKTAGLDPASVFDWDGRRPPYPGLMAFQEKDAAIFFGRESEVQKGLELLNRLRQFGGARTVMVLGASGSGKSSLVRAGIVPRLRRDNDRWLVVSPFRPGKEPLRELAVSLAEALGRNGAAANADGIHGLLKAEKPMDAAEALIGYAKDIRIAAGHREAMVVLVIDQTEELLTYGVETGRGAHQFLSVLDAASSAPGSPLMTIATLRSDFLGDLQVHPATRSLAFEHLQLGPLPKERLVKVIEGPAEMAALRLERGLTEEMIKDTQTDDALPLLAFTLRELYEKYGDDKVLHVKDFREKLGGLAGSVAKAAEAVYEAKLLAPEQQTDLRRAFRTLVRVNEEGKYMRQSAARSDLPSSILDLLERFVQARLLVARGDGKNQVLEVAHEAIFRSWERLRSWLDEDREFLLWQQRLRGRAQGWARNSRDKGALLRGADLTESERYLQNYEDKLPPFEREYLDKSLAERDREGKDKQRELVTAVKDLLEISIGLSSELDINRLLETIVVAAKKITNAEGGTLYRMTEEKTLRFEILRNDSLGLAIGGTSGVDIPFYPISLYDKDGQPIHTMPATYAVHHDRSVNIADAYAQEGFDFSGTKAFDKKTGYRSKSILTVLMKNHEGEIMGVLQLINAKDAATGGVVAFSETDQHLLESLASQAAFALTNRLLINHQDKLLESVISVISDAIDDKSEYTGGHCQRVPVLTMLLAEAVNNSHVGPLKDFMMNDRDRYELKIASLLHDCGMVTTPVHVLDKATKLQTIFDRIELVETRFEVIKRGAEFELGRGSPELEGRLREIEDDLEFLRRTNIGREFMRDVDVERVRAIARKYRWRNPVGAEVNLLSDDEEKNLTIRAGTLTPEERKVVDHHITKTIQMLEVVPWPNHLRNVPEYAGGHHERMDGKGYPRGLRREQMSVQARCMGIVDIFEALTHDRPYRKGKTLSEALTTLGELKLNGHIDPDLFDIFMWEKVYERYAKQFLDPDQIDAVDVTQIPGYVALSFRK